MALDAMQHDEAASTKHRLWHKGLVLLNAPFFALRVYQWLWLLLCLVGALAAALPRILTQPVIYRAGAELNLDVNGRYRELYSDGAPDTDFFNVQWIALEALRTRFPALGAPTTSVRFTPRPDGSISVFADAADPIAAQRLADDAAETLARSARAAGGREILRNLLGWELNVALQGQLAGTPFQGYLREMIRTTAFPLNRPVEPNPQQLTIEQLTAEDLSDLARALEVRELQISRMELPALEEQRRNASGAALEQLDRDQRRLNESLQAIRDGLRYLYQARDAVFAPDARSGAYRSSRATLPAASEDRRILELTVLAVLFGLAFGVAGVALDRSAGVLPKLRELWSYRELMRNLVLRDLRARYKGSALGYLWTQLAPLLLMTVFWVVFSFFLDTNIAMYPIFLIVGMLAWNYCAEAVNGGARSVLDNANLIKKVFFPREVLPLVSVLSSLVNYLLSLPMMFVLIIIVQLWYAPLGQGAATAGQMFPPPGGLHISWTIAYLPVLLVIQTIFLAGVTLFLSALAVFFRDAIHLIGILVQFWFFLTPVVYSFENVGHSTARIIRWLNPMASLVEFYREILYGNTVGVGQIPTPGLPALTSVLRVLLTTIVVLAVGYWFFQRNSGKFGEEI